MNNEASEAASGPLRVLCAEDNQINQEMIVETFELIDNTVLKIVENGAEAIKELDEETFDLVLLDINMPVMTGDEAIQIIRSSDKPYNDIPIIVLTANALEMDKRNYLSIGATNFVAKPIDLTELIDLVETYKTTARSAA